LFQIHNAYTLRRATRLADRSDLHADHLAFCRQREDLRFIRNHMSRDQGTVFAVICAILMPDRHDAAFEFRKFVCLAKPFSMTAKSFASAAFATIANPATSSFCFFNFMARTPAAVRPIGRICFHQTGRLSLASCENNLIAAACKPRPLELISFLERDRDDPVAPNILESFKRRLFHRAVLRHHH